MGSTGKSMHPMRTPRPLHPRPAPVEWHPATQKALDEAREDKDDRKEVIRMANALASMKHKEIPK